MADARGNLLGRRSSPPSKRAMVVLGTGIVLLGVLVAIMPADALIPSGEDIMRGVASVLQAIVGFIGQLLLIMVNAMIWIAQYNGFVNSTPVATGWTLVRDVANMFFIVALLVIAFGTIFGSSKYNYEGKRLTTFLIMAIVVNFSRTLCGLIIDFAQVVMLTFVNGFKEAAGGNFVDALQLGNLMQVNPNAKLASATNIVVSFLLALTMLGMSLFLMIIITAVLVVRIVYLWLLVVLSPIAFLARAVPFSGTQSYYSRWWGMFTKQVTVGPVLAFFLWLSLVSVSAGNLDTEGFQGGKLTGSESLGDSYSAVFNTTSIQSFIISFGLLAGGLMMAKEMSPEGVGAFQKAKGAVKWGAGQVAKRTGVTAALDRSRQEREKKYGERGARLYGGGASLRGGLQEGVGKGMLALAPNAANKRARLLGQAKGAREELAKLEASGKGTSPEATALRAKAEGLEGKARDTKPGALERFAQRRVANAQRISRRGARVENEAVLNRMRDLPPMSRQEMKDRAAGRIASADDLEYRAVALKAAQEGYLEGDEIEYARGQLKSSDAATQDGFEQSVIKSNFMESGKLPPELKQKWLNSGKLNVDSLSDNDIARQAESIATSQNAAGYAEKMSLPQLKAYNEALGDAKNRLSVAPAGESDGSRAARLGNLQKVESAMLRSDITGGGERAFGIRGGKFSGEDAGGSAERMVQGFKGLGAAKAALNVKAEDIVGGDGAITEVGMAMAEAFGANRNALSEMARSASTEDQSKTVAALVEAIKQRPDKIQGGTAAANTAKASATAAAESVTKSRALDNYQSYAPAVERRAAQERQEAAVARQEAVVKVEGEIKVSEQNISSGNAELGKLQQQLQAELNKGAKGNQRQLGQLREKIGQVQKKIDSFVDGQKKLKEQRDKLARG